MGQSNKLTFDLLTSIVVYRVTCDMGYPFANFSLPRPLCSRLRPDVRDRQTSDSIIALCPASNRRGHKAMLLIMMMMMIIIIEAPYGRNFRGSGRSQINEDTVERSLTAHDINPVAYVP